MTLRLQRYAFVSSRAGCCNTVLAGSSKATTDRLQRVLNAAAWVISETHEFDGGLTHLLHSELPWLDVAERIQFKFGVTVHRCLQGKAPQYLVVCCKSSSLQFGTSAELSRGHFGTGTEMSGHFGTSLMVPKCLRSELSWVRSVCTPEPSILIDGSAVHQTPQYKRRKDHVRYVVPYRYVP